MNPYEILGVDKNSEQNEIKKAYRKLSLQFHPDRNSTELAKTRIIEINDAYEKIGNVDSRKQYDQKSIFHSMNNMTPNNGSQDDLMNFFDMVFGGSVGVHVYQGSEFPGNGFPGSGFSGFHHQLEKPLPIIKNILISLEESYNGCNHLIEIDRWTITNNMKISEKIKIDLNILQGTDDNDIIILRECGNIINNQIKGDLKIIVSVQNTTSFIRDGLDLIFYKKISLKESLCGLSFVLKKIDGENVVLNSNKKVFTIICPKFRKIIPMMGMIRDGKTGNLIIEFDVEYPDKLTIEQINALSEIL